MKSCKRLRCYDYGSFFRGRGNCYQLGHGNRGNLFRPKAIDSLNDNPVVDVAVGNNHVVAVTQTRLVFFWGSHDPDVSDDLEDKIPVVVGKPSGALNVGIAAGPSQVNFLYCITFIK